jgi:signal transduction histidine kinase
VTSLIKPSRERGPQRSDAAPERLFGRVSRLWTGSSDLPVQLQMEQRFILLRYVGIICLLPTLPLFALSPAKLAAAYLVLLSATLYNGWVAVAILRRRHLRWLRQGYITTFGDGACCIAMLLIFGDFGSSFYLCLFTATMAAAIRYGYKPAMLLVSIYVLLDAIFTGLIAQAPGDNGGNFLVRSVFLAITVMLTGYLREHARTAETALARQLEHASALNDSTRALSASLDTPTVVKTIAAEARHLVAADAAAVLLGSGDDQAIVFCPEAASEHADVHKALLSDLLHGTPAVPGAPAIHETAGGDYCYMIAPVHIRSDQRGWIAVLRDLRTPAFAQDDHAILQSFADRAALALEKSLLYARLDERSRDLKRAYADLAAAHHELLSVDEMKTNFIANVSHELRTPLTSIRSFSEILLTFEVDVTTRQEFVGIINDESERLTRLINDVLDITKIESGYVDWHMQTHDLIDMLRASARSFASLARDKNLHFRFDEPDESMFVNADGDRIIQVLSNLLGNAVKFTNEGEIVVWAEVVEDMAQIHVRDTGIGIAPSDHVRIFEKFHQVGNTLTSKPTGSGLGLCICRDIIEHHGGKIWVDSAPGAGSIFSFTLPLARHGSVASSSPYEHASVHSTT